MQIRLLPLFVFIPLLIFSCSKDGDDPIACADPVLQGTAICLSIEQSAELEPYRDQIRQITRETLLQVRRLMPIDNLTIQVADAPGEAIPEIGLGGFNPDAEQVLIYANPSFPDFEEALRQELAFQLAHEIHHARRRRAIGYGNSLHQAIVSEGLADHFAMELTGKPAPLWSLAVQGSELEELFEQAETEWDNNSYDHTAWFFGSTQAIPRWAGYSMGYELVRRYKESHPGALASEMYGTPASEFAP